MNISETFTPKVYRNGIPRPVRRLGETRIEGPLAGWASDRQKLGDTVMAKHVYVVPIAQNRSHQVAWVYHEGIGISGMPYSVHHVACDCSGDVEQAETYDAKAEVMRECPGTPSVLQAQADAVNASLYIEDLMHSAGYYPGAEYDDQPQIAQEFVQESVLHLLRHDHAFPQSWIANTESGWTIKALLSAIYRIPPDHVDQVIDALAEAEKVETDGIAVRLTEEEKAKVELDLEFQRITQNF